jgi:dihydropteroate synthase
MVENTGFSGLRPLDFFWSTSRFNLSLHKPLLMGIVNVTPDSFSDNGKYLNNELAILHAAKLVKEGADILDIGGESSRPGATPINAQQEWQRIGAVIDELVRWGVPLSLDSYRLETQLRALDKGVDIINDIWALQHSGAVERLLNYRCGVCLMHMNGEPLTMQRSPMIGTGSEGFARVKKFLAQRANSLRAAGFAKERIVLDPGIGFGKTVPQNLFLLKNQTELMDLGYPTLMGWSRKSTLGEVTECAVDERLTPSIAALIMALDRGANILRVHDVKESAQALKVWSAVQCSQ